VRNICIFNESLYILRKKKINQGELVIEDTEKPCLTYPGCPYGSLAEILDKKTEKSKLICTTFENDCPIFYFKEPITEKLFRIPKNYNGKLYHKVIHWYLTFEFEDGLSSTNKPIISRKAQKPCHILDLCPYGSLGKDLRIRRYTSKFKCKVFARICPIFYHFEPVTGYTKEDLREKKRPKIDQSQFKKIDWWFNEKRR